MPHQQGVDAPPKARRGTRAHRNEIDGLRAVAVVPVVLFHGGFGGLPGGFLGVDVFFVISGYLITTILLGDLAGGTFSLARFYERRVRRIVPALFVVMAACLPVAWYALAPNDLEDFCESVVAVTLCCSNVLFWRQSGYFDTASELKPLLHTWSLGVEEQYYILFPFLLAALRRAGQTTVMAVLGTLAVGSFALATWLSGVQPEAGFFLLPSRAWELILGAMAAVHVHHRGRLPDGQSSFGQSMSLLGLGMIVASMLLVDSHAPTPGPTTLIPTVGTVLVILFASTDRNIVARILSTAPAVAIGLISYSVYLWHQPLFVFARHLSIDEPSVFLSAVLTVATFVLGALTWAFVERPFRSSDSIPRARLFGMAAAGSLAFAALGVAGIQTRGFAGREAFTATAIPGYDLDNNAIKARTEDLLHRAVGADHYAVVGDPGDQKPWFTSSEATTKILIIGNSHAMDLYNTFASCPEFHPGMEFARYGIQLSDFGHPEGERMFESPNYKAADAVVVSTRWSGFRFEARSRGRSDFKGLEVLIPRVERDGKTLAICSETPHFPQFGTLTLADMTAIRLSRRGAAPLPASECIDLINRRYYQSLHGSRRTEATNALLRQLTARYGCLFLDKEDFLCDRAGATCLAVLDDGAKTFWDEAHFTLDGARAFGERAARIDWLRPVTDSLAGRKPSPSAPEAR